MKFLSLFSKIGLSFSQLMGISSPANFIAGGSNQIESPNNFFETIWIIILKTITKLTTSGFEVIIKLIYSIAKWMLTAIDFMFVLVRQMIGINVDFTDAEAITKSDLIFKFVFSDRVIGVIKAMIGYAILLIILFSIFAIIKTEYNFITQGSGNSKKKVLTNALHSLFLMVLVPVLFVGGLILSNALARTLFIATSGGTDTSLGAQIFVTSSYDANRFRDYAHNNLKIPITFNFDKVDDQTDNVSGWGTDGNIAELDQALIDFKSSNVWNRGYTTFLMFYMDTFIEMDRVDQIEWGLSHNAINEESSYNYTYDKNIYTTRDQYFVMGDFIDYAVKTEQKFYYKTIEQVYESCTNNDLPESIKQKINLNAAKIGTEGDDYFINVTYKDFGYTTTKIIHKKGATSESDGATFILAREVLFMDGDTIYSVFCPVYTSDFSQSNQGLDDECVVARGLFDEDGYPTAIKQEDGAVKFYRDDLNIPTILDFFPTISYEKPEGTTNAIPGLEIIKAGITGLTGVDVTQFIPYIYYSFDIFNLFTKQTYNIVTLEDGYLKLDFNFSQDGYVISNVYNLMNLNVIIMVVSSMLIIGMLLKIIFGLAHRIMDVTLLAIAYPAVISTYPLDNGERFKIWADKMIKKIIGIYGIVIGINLVLWMFPILDELDLFNIQHVDTAIANGLLSSRLGVGFLNCVTELLFMLVAFTLLESTATMYEKIITNAKDGESGIIAEGEKTVNDLKAIPGKAASVISGKAFIDIGKEVLDTGISLIPGSAIAKTYIKNKKKSVSFGTSAVEESAKEVGNELAEDTIDTVTEPVAGEGVDYPEDKDEATHSNDKHKDENSAGSDKQEEEKIPRNPIKLIREFIKESKRMEKEIAEQDRDPEEEIKDKKKEDENEDYSSEEFDDKALEYQTEKQERKDKKDKAATELYEAGVEKREKKKKLRAERKENNKKIRKARREVIKDKKETDKKAKKDLSEEKKNARKYIKKQEQFDRKAARELEKSIKGGLDERSLDSMYETRTTEEFEGFDDIPKDPDLEKFELVYDTEMKTKGTEEGSETETTEVVVKKDGETVQQTTVVEPSETKKQETEDEIHETIENKEADESSDSVEKQSDGSVDSDVKESKDHMTDTAIGLAKQENKGETEEESDETQKQESTEEESKSKDEEKTDSEEAEKQEEKEKPEIEPISETESSSKQSHNETENNSSNAQTIEIVKEEIEQAIDPVEQEKERRAELAKKLGVKTGTIESASNYADTFADGYVDYLDEQGSDDSDEERAKYFIQKRNQAKIEGKQEEFEDDVRVANDVHDPKEVETQVHFTKLRKEGYQEFLTERGARDSSIERARFTRSEEKRAENGTEEDKEKFRKDHELAGLTTGGRDKVNKYVHYKKDDYDKFLDQTQEEDSMLSRSKFYAAAEEQIAPALRLDAMKKENGDARVQYSRDRVQSMSEGQTEEEKKQLAQDFDNSLLAPDDPNKKQ